MQENQSDRHTSCKSGETPDDSANLKTSDLSPERLTDLSSTHNDTALEFSYNTIVITYLWFLADSE